MLGRENRAANPEEKPGYSTLRSGWEEFKKALKPPGNVLVSVVSVRLNEIAIARDLGEQYLENMESVKILFNKSTGEVALMPLQKNEGFSIRGGEGNSCYLITARAFLSQHHIERGHYPAEWRSGMIVFQPWEPEKETREEILRVARATGIDPSEMTMPQDQELDKVDFCPECEELTFRNGVCSNCGYGSEKEYIVTCPKGCSRPLEDVDGKCLDCESYQRKWGERPEACKWEGWK